MSYCSFCSSQSEDSVHKKYHDYQYGFPLFDDNELFGRLILEINQAGLSWDTILKKEENFRKAYDQYNIQKISQYGEPDFERLMADAGIIRNRLKINAAIHNANKLVSIIEDSGSFHNWIVSHHPLELKEWVKLFKKNFKFVGGEIVNEFLMSIGILKGAHVDTCVIQKEILNLKPLWQEK